MEENKLKTYIILFLNTLPEIVSADSPNKALFYTAVDDLGINIEKEKIEEYETRNLISEINKNISDTNCKICAIYELGNFYVLCDDEDL